MEKKDTEKFAAQEDVTQENGKTLLIDSLLISKPFLSKWAISSQLEVNFREVDKRIETLLNGGSLDPELEKFRETDAREEAFVESNYGIMTREEMSEELGCSFHHIRDLIKKLIKEGRIKLGHSTKSRKNEEKIQYIINNYHSTPGKKICDALGETPRWLKRQVSNLIKEGKLKPKRNLPEKSITAEDWSPSIKDRACQLRTDYLKTNIEICKILRKEFNFIINPGALQIWFGRFGCQSRTKEDWLDEYLPSHLIEDLMGEPKYLRVLDLQRLLKDKFGVYVSDDLILSHIKKNGLESQKERAQKRYENKVKAISKESLEREVADRSGARSLAKKFGVTSKRIKEKLEETGVKLLPRRRIWSKNLEILRDQLLDLELASVPNRHQMILGWLAGDGHLDKNGRFTINHSIKQLSYFYFKVRVLRDFISTIGTVRGIGKDSKILNSKEQFGLEMPNMKEYLKYLNPDGSRNFDKIFLELDDLGWACYFMDDGSLGPLMTVSKEISDRFENKFNFGSRNKKKDLRLNSISEEYIIPSMAYKLRNMDNACSFWVDKVPEMYDLTIQNDLDLSLLNPFVCEEGKYIDDAVVYYHQRGFPHYSVSDDYLIEAWNDLKVIDTKHLWKDDNTIRHCSVGDLIFKHFMPHMVEASHGGGSPLNSFNSHEIFANNILYVVNKWKPPIPDNIYNNLIYVSRAITGFQAASAKCLASKFCDGDVVVDPCGGWGGRLLGSVAAGKKYVAFEPWKKTADSLKEMTKFLDVDCEIIEGNFDKEKAPKECHLILTSPPYVDLETYGETMTFDQWYKLMKLIFLYAEESLALGSFVLLNIPSHLCHKLPDTTLEKVGYVGIHTAPKSRVPSEKVFIWKKSS